MPATFAAVGFPQIDMPLLGPHCRRSAMQMGVPRQLARLAAGLMSYGNMLMARVGAAWVTTPSPPHLRRLVELL